MLKRSLVQLLLCSHIVLDGDPAPPPPKGHSPQFSANVCCGRMALWIKMPLGREVGLSPSDIVLDGDPAPRPKKGAEPPPIFGPCLLWPNGWMPLSTQASPLFGLCLLWPWSPISATAELLFKSPPTSYIFYHMLMFLRNRPTCK